MVMVTTASGRRERFDPQKIYRTCLRTGASRDLAKEVVEEVSRNVTDGMSTRRILDMVLDSLRRHRAEAVACRYDLKSAIMRMGPAGFTFETFLCQVFEKHGYQAKLRQKVSGLCVEHEIDLVLEKEGKRSMVEVKYHNGPGIYTGLKEALYTYARFLDLLQGHENGRCERFDEAWLATNTRSSEEARKYASCKGIKLLGWKYPRRGGIERLIEEKGLYPVTVLPGIDSEALEAFDRAKMLLVSDIAARSPEDVSKATRLPLSKTREFVERAARVLSPLP